MIDIYIEDDLKEAIKLLKQLKKIDLSTLFIAIFNSLSQRYSSQEEITFDQSLLIQQEGNDIDANLDVKSFKTTVTSSLKFVDFIKVQEQSLSEAINFGSLKKLNNKDTQVLEGIKNELVKALFVVQQKNSAKSEGSLFEVDHIITQVLGQFDLFHIGLFLKENDSFFDISIFYNQNTVDDSFAQQFKKHFVNLLSAAVSDPYKAIGSYNILSPDEYDAVIYKFNDTIVPYQKESTLHYLFEEQVLKTPKAIALTKGDEVMSYDELNKKANILSQRLIAKGLKPGDNVGLIVTRDFEMIIGMLGILKAGGAYVPIDHDYPVERQHYIFNHSMAKMIVADAIYPIRDMVNEMQYVHVNKEAESDIDSSNPSLTISSKQLAYTIYTSGSTGKPKGVMIEHHSAVNLVSWVNKTFNVNQTDNLLFITSMCFDLSVYDIFGMLAAGGTLVIAEKKEIQNVTTLQDMLVNHKITFWDSVPTTMDYLVKNLEKERSNYSYTGLKTVFMSGDWIPVDLPNGIKRFFPEAQVVSLGGATEGTVWSNYYMVDTVDNKWSSIPYGKPIDNNFFYILNEHLQPVPNNVVGDLYIGGIGVARGYANDVEKTDASFILDPFNKSAGGMMYKTGDLGKMKPDFNMEFIGRKDNQVKINGFRIELGEIENVLKSSDMVANAVVLAKNDINGKKVLISYVVWKDKEGRLDQEKITAYLKNRLPAYMIPSIWIELEKLPLTSNGKIDRKTLLGLDVSILLKEKVAEYPNTPTEQILFDIWKDLSLHVSGINDNFFELGGHSLMAVQMLNKFKKAANKSFQLAVLYQYPDIRSLARFIDTDQNSFNYEFLVPIKSKGNKTPLYIVQGDSGNILNFSNLIKYINRDQPVYGLKAIGLDGILAPFEDLKDIAAHYIKEIIQHNPEGPYLIAGYSSGAYVAVEIRKQMLAMGKVVKPLIIIDADAGMTEYKHKYKLIPKKIMRNYPKLLTYIKSSIMQPTIFNSSKPLNHDHTDGHSAEQLKEIKNKRERAFAHYTIEPFNDEVILIKAQISVHYVDQGRYLGWEHYATKGVKLYEVPGDHFSILLPPYVQEFASTLQGNLNEYQTIREMNHRIAS